MTDCSETKKELNDLLFNNAEDPDVVGNLKNPNLTPVFSLARLDKIKNLTSLARWFGESKELQEISNLIIVAGNVRTEDSNDEEEKEQIQLMHSIINEYNLHDKIRWIGKLFRKDQTGEVYRLIADHKGVFVQPALFEGFGLTVLEAMHSGLPVFATMYGGPLEIIEDQINGFHIDPVNADETTKKLLDFLEKFKKMTRCGIEFQNGLLKEWKKIITGICMRKNYWSLQRSMDSGDILQISKWRR